MLLFALLALLWGIAWEIGSLLLDAVEALRSWRSRG